MPMTYNFVDPTEREKDMVATTGHGDTSLLTDQHALGAESSVSVLKLRKAFFDDHATNPLPNPDPDAAAFQQQADTLAGAITEAEATRDRIIAATTTDVSGVMQPILDANRRVAEQNFYDSEWTMNNVPGLTQEQIDKLQCHCDRAEREVGVIDAWV